MGNPNDAPHPTRQIMIIVLLGIIGIGVISLFFLASYLQNSSRNLQDTPTVPVTDPEWDLLISENFDTNTNKWFEGTSPEANLTVIHTVIDGKYRWAATSHQNFAMRQIRLADSINDFYFSMEAQNTGEALAEYGIIFREDDKGNFYFFALTTPVNSCAILQYYNGEWTPLTPWDDCPSFSPTAINRINILVQDDYFVAFINDQMVGETISDLIKGNNVGIAINLDDSGSTTSFEFDNLELRIP